MDEALVKDIDKADAFNTQRNNRNTCSKQPARTTFARQSDVRLRLTVLDKALVKKT